MTHRDVLPEERMALNMLRKSQALFLAPVQYKGEERYALATKLEKNGKEFIHILAICVNLEDKGEIVSSVDGEVAGPLDSKGSKVPLN